MASILGTSDSAEGELAAALTGLRRKNRDELRVEYDTAIDYAENRMRDDVEQALLERFPNSQAGDLGQQIYPVTMGLTERYVAEAANAYNRPVTYTLVGEDGKESDATREQTDKLKRAHEDCARGERMHRNEQVTVLLGSSAVWYQAKRGNIAPVVTLPHDVYEVVPEDLRQHDPSDPEDYEGFVVELRGGENDVMRGARARSFAFVQKEETTFFTGPDPWSPDKITGRYKNPYAWNQAEDGVTPAGLVSTHEREAPGQMLTFWHRRFPIGGVITQTDADIVHANRELNILWSVLFDTLRFQAHATPVIKLSNPNSPQATMRHGARWPVAIGLLESFDYAQAANSYSDQVDVLKAFARMLAIAKRQSPNDFSIDAASAASGFAKLVDSLPKLEARQERIRRLMHMEQHVAWPRERAILVRLGRLDKSVMKMRLRAQFADVEFPETPDETAKKLETDIKYNLTTPAKILAKRTGVSLEEAQTIIDENAAANSKSVQQPPAPGVGGLFGGMASGPRLGGMIGQRGAAKKTDPKGEDDDGA